MITKELVNKSIDYIMQHLDEDISIEDVADYCHFSKYYFSRVFKAETGESIYAFIKRLKLEQSALRLKIEKEKSITDIGFDYGYSPSNYSSAFRKCHKISPAQFRKEIDISSVVHPIFTDKFTKFKLFEDYNKQIIIKELKDFLVIYERHIGNYIELSEKWCEFIEKYKDYYKEDTLLIERTYDDPSITRVDQCLYDLCMTVDKDCDLDNVTKIQGGKYAVYRFDGLIQEIFFSFQGIFNVWIPNSGYHIDERYGFEIYRNIDKNCEHFVIDLCIPIK